MWPAERSTSYESTDDTDCDVHNALCRVILLVQSIRELVKHTACK